MFQLLSINCSKFIFDIYMIRFEHSFGEKKLIMMDDRMAAKTHPKIVASFVSLSIVVLLIIPISCTSAEETVFEPLPHRSMPTPAARATPTFTPIPVPTSVPTETILDLPVSSSPPESMYWEDIQKTSNNISENILESVLYEAGDESLLDQPRLEITNRGIKWALRVTDRQGGMVILNGQSLGRYTSVDSPTFSPDGKSFAYLARRGKETFVVLNGQELDNFDLVEDLVFSPDGSRLAYNASIGGQSFAVIDNEPSDLYDWVGKVTFNRDGSRYAFVVEDEGEIFVILDGEESSKYDWVGRLVFSPDGSRFAHVATKDRYSFIVLDGEEQETFDSVDELMFSSSGSHFAFLASKSPDSFVVLDGEHLTSYDAVAFLSFSPEGSRLAYAAKSGDTWAAVLDGEEVATYEIVDRPTFSSDGSRFGFGVREDGFSYVVIDGQAKQKIEGPWRLRQILFSLDGSRLAYRFKDTQSKDSITSILDVVDGQKFHQVDNVKISSPEFSPDGQKFAVLLLDAGVLKIVYKIGQ